MERVEAFPPTELNSESLLGQALSQVGPRPTQLRTSPSRCAGEGREDSSGCVPRDTGPCEGADGSVAVAFAGNGPFVRRDKPA